MSYAARLKQAPTPEQRLKALADYYKTLPPTKILSEALGSYTPMLLKTPDDARPLVEHIIVICVDTESYTMNTDQMTELGLVYISRKTAKGVGPPGSHGWKLQEALKFLHFRVVEHAHLKSNRVDSKGPLGNRFGNTRFASFSELRLILDNLFNQEIETDDPNLKGCKRPIILVGHALRHDTENTNKRGLEYNLDDNLTIVAKVDTQALARETKVWVPSPGMLTNEIGLRVMIENLGFQHLDDHTACNDAARTMICAVHMILPDVLQHSDSPSMQAVADRVETKSKVTSGAPYGTAKCCIRCAARDHSADDCTADICCAACDRFDRGDDRDLSITSHIETYCPHVANFKAWLRRYRDAVLKGRVLTAEVAAGPSVDSHPWSTWPQAVRWPLIKLSDASYAMKLVEHNAQFQEPAPYVHNVQAALGGIAVPSTGNWVTSSSGSLTAGTTTTASSVAPPASNGVSMAMLNSALPALPTNGTTAGAWSSGFPNYNGASVSSAASSPPPAPTNSTASALVAAREVTMSVSRGRGRGERGRGGTRSGLGRDTAQGGRGDGGADGAGAGSDPSWNPASVW